MAYYMDDHGEYSGDYPFNPYYNSYDSAAVQASMAYSNYKSNDYQIFAYDPIPLYDPVSSYSSTTAYSVSSSIESKYIQHDPDLHYPAQSQFIISYSVSELDKPDFEEYDPTPYGGGYDLTLTYGKPLPPSDETCYPLSKPDPGTLPSNGVSSGQERAETPDKESQPTATSEPEKQQQLGEYEPVDLYPGEETKEKYGYGDEIGCEYEKRVAVHEIPSGYGLEAMDICEGLFGYWPCLSRSARRGKECEEMADVGNCSNQWKGSADYLFGSPYPYGDTSDSWSAS